MRFSSISVVMPNYNHGRNISAALGSLFSQTRLPDEVIVVDDGSTDDSVSVIESFVGKYPALRLIRNEKNMGVMFSCELALGRVTGEYVLFLAADDVILPGLLEKSMKLLEACSAAAYCCSDSRTIFEDSGKSAVNRRRLARGECYIAPERLVAMMRERIIYLSGFGAVFRKKCIDETGLLPQLLWSGDRVFSTVLALRHGMCYIPEVLSVHMLKRGSYGLAGLMNWGKHRDVVSGTLDMLHEPRYADVLPKFKTACALAGFNLPLLRVILWNRKYWDYLSFRLAWLVLAGSLKEAVAGSIPAFAKKAYWRMQGWGAE